MRAGGGLEGGGAFLVNVLVNLLADSIFSQSTQTACFKFHTWFFQGLCFYVMSCSFQLVPNVLVKNAFFGDRYFLYLFFRKFLCLFHNSKLFKVFGWTFMGM